MAIISLFLPHNGDGWQLVHAQVSCATAEELRRRLANFACDIFMYAHEMLTQNHRIRDCTCLWSLIGQLIFGILDFFS